MAVSSALAFDTLLDSIEKVIVGKREVAKLLLVALLCEGHVLIEDVPGVGKTLLAKTLAASLDCSFRRLQFTPDLLPSDITGSHVFNQQTAQFEFRPGPVFASILLADEINRATPRTQSALLEAMEERQEGEILLRFAADDPLPAVKPIVDAGQLQEWQQQRGQVRMTDDVRDYLVKVVRSTRNNQELELGASPRAALALYRACQAWAALDGRDYV